MPATRSCATPRASSEIVQASGRSKAFSTTGANRSAGWAKIRSTMLRAKISARNNSTRQLEGDPEAAGMVYSAVEEFAQEFGGHPGGIMAPLRRCPKREDAVERLTDFLTTLIGRAEKRGPDAGAVHRRGLSGRDSGGRHRRSRRAEPAGQLGGQEVQSLRRHCRHPLMAAERSGVLLNRFRAAGFDPE